MCICYIFAPKDFSCLPLCPLKKKKKKKKNDAGIATEEWTLIW